MHSTNELPSEIESFECEGEIWIAKALTLCKLHESTSQARRDIKARAISVNSQKIDDEQMQLKQGEYILQVGKRKFAKLRVR